MANHIDTQLVDKLSSTVNDAKVSAKERLKAANFLLHTLPPVKSQINTNNNGGDTDYYRIDPSWEMAQDIIEDRDMNFSQGNIFKAAFTFNVGRHDASNYERELNKIIWFAQRELQRIKEQ